MAEIESIKEDFLTCSICTEEYTDPCTLNCQHSFCRKCVTQFLKTRPDSVQSKTIPCAFCRQVTPVPNPTRPVEEWSKQLKPSLMLQGLMDKLQSGHKHTKGKDICFMCEKLGETTPASSWCSDCEITLCRRCVKMHLEGPATKKHDLFDLSGGFKVKQIRKVKCKEHDDEPIKFICKDCNKALCQTCCVVNHRTCKHVVTIKSLIPEIKTALTEKRRILGQKMKANITLVRRVESNVEKLKNNDKRTEEEIQSTTQNAITLLRKRENDLLKELHDISGKQITEHQAYVKAGQITAQMYQQHCEFIDQALNTESEVGMYDMYQVCLSGAVDSEADTNYNTRSIVDEREVKFTPNMEPLQKAIAEMGKIGETFLMSKRDLKTLTPRLHDTIDIKHAEDVESFYPHDVTVLTVGGVHTVVFTEKSNNSLKSVFFQNNQRQMSRLILSDEPYRLTNSTGNRVAATLDNKKIVIAEVRPELVLISTLKTNKQYNCITSLRDSTLFVGSNSPSAVDLVDMTGKVLKSFTPQNTGLKLIENPDYLCTTHEGNILVADCGSQSIYCLTPNGSIVFTYTPERRSISNPRGIAVTTSGDILLSVSLSNKIIQLTPDGTFVRDVLTSADGIDEPWGLCVDDSDKLYVCKLNAENMCIKVFNFT